MTPRRGVRATGAAWALAFVLLLATAASAQHDDAPGSLPPPPAGPAAIRGQVVHATTGEPVAGADVALYALSAMGAPGVARATSDAEGRFSFEGLSNDPSNSYLVGARHGGVPHPGGRVQFPAGQLEVAVRIPVTDVVQDAGAVQLAEAIYRLDRLGGSVRVGQSFDLRNAGTTSYFVPRDARAGARPALEVVLPPGATELDMPLGVMPEGLERVGDRLRYWGPLHPGPSELAWSYLLPLDAEGNLDFAPEVPRGAASTALLVGEGAEVRDAGRLVAGEPQTLDGRVYARYAATGGGPVDVALAFAPSRVDPDALSVQEVRFVMHGDDAALEIQESHVLEVTGETGVRAPSDREPLLAIPLPDGASNLRFGTSDPGLVLAPNPAGGLGVLGAAPPGESRIDLAYRIPAGAEATRFSRSFSVDVPLVSLFLADTGALAVTSDRLHRRRPARTNDLTYMHLEAFEVAPGEEVSVEIAARQGRVALPRAALLPALLVMAAAAIAFVIGPLRRTAGGETAPEPEEDAGARERAALYAAIADLEHDHETGKVSDEDHQMLRDDLRARAVAQLRSERAPTAVVPAAQAEPAAPAPEPGAPGALDGRVCASCGKAAQVGDRFCAGCGSPLPDGAKAPVR